MKHQYLCFWFLESSMITQLQCWWAVKYDNTIAVLGGHQQPGCSTSGMYGWDCGSFASKFRPSTSLLCQPIMCCCWRQAGGCWASYNPGGTGSTGCDATVSSGGQKCMLLPVTAAVSTGGCWGARVLAGGTGTAKGRSSDWLQNGVGGGCFLCYWR